MRRRRNRSGADARIGKLPYPYEEKALEEIKLVARHYAPQLNQLEYAIGRPIVLGATMERPYLEHLSEDEIVVTFDGVSAGATGWASPDQFIKGAMWLLEQLSKGEAAHEQPVADPNEYPHRSGFDLSPSVTDSDVQALLVDQTTIYPEGNDLIDLIKAAMSGDDRSASALEKLILEAKRVTPRGGVHGGYWPHAVEDLYDGNMTRGRRRNARRRR